MSIPNMFFGMVLGPAHCLTSIKPFSKKNPMSFRKVSFIKRPKVIWITMFGWNWTTWSEVTGISIVGEVDIAPRRSQCRQLKGGNLCPKNHFGTQFLVMVAISSLWLFIVCLSKNVLLCWWLFVWGGGCILLLSDVCNQWWNFWYLAYNIGV